MADNKSSKKDATKKIAIGAALAGAVGYITGLLTAPKSGKETREDIADAAWDVRDNVEGQLRNVSDELKDLIEQTRTKTIALSSQAREDFNETVVKAKDAQNKATTILKAAKSGQASDPELNKAVKQARQAIKSLSKYLKNGNTKPTPRNSQPRKKRS